MKITPIKTYIAAALIAAAPLSKTLAQNVAKDSTNFSKPLVEAAKETKAFSIRTIFVTAHGGMVKNSPLAEFGVQFPKILSVKSKSMDKEILRGNLDFFGVAFKNNAYKEVTPNLRVRASLLSQELDNMPQGTSLKVVTMANLNYAGRQMTADATPTSPAKYKQAVEVNTLTGLALGAEIGKNIKATFMPGVLTSNLRKPEVGGIFSVIARIKGNLMGFIKAEKMPDNQVGAGLIYRIK